MKIKGAEMVVEMLLENGVDTIFGYPGGAAMVIYDALYKHSDQIRHVLTAHEQGASHAADGYARSTGKTGVVLATSGPGATNLVTGIATAYMDSIPMVAITANVGAGLVGRDAFQEICITGVTFPVTKHSYFVNKKEDLADALRNAFRIANEGRKGPVLVDITKDVTEAMINYIPAEPLEPARREVEDLGSKAEKFAEFINKAERPVVYAGGGIIASEADSEVLALLEKADIPAVNTMMASGAVPSDNERSFGLLGMHGSFAANKAIAEADLVIAIGTRFSDRVALNPKKFAAKAKIIQIDIDRSEINKNVYVDYSINGDCREVLDAVLEHVDEKDHKDWIRQLKKWQKERPMHIRGYSDIMNPQQIIEYVCEHTDNDTIYVTDVGQHQMWAAQFINHKAPRRFLSSGGLGTMGYGYGAAIGAQIGNPDKRVIHFTGDGSFHMNLNEACTAVSENTPVITIIMNNRVLGMVYQWQSQFFEGRHSQTVPERKTDFVKIIEGFGGTGFRADTLEEFEEAFEKALKCEGPVWIDCEIVMEEKVLPMIPNGLTVDEMIFE